MTKQPKPQSFSKTLAAYKRDLGLGFEELQTLIGVKRMTLWSWFSGRQRPAHPITEQAIIAKLEAIKQRKTK